MYMYIYLLPLVDATHQTDKLLLHYMLVMVRCVHPCSVLGTSGENLDDLFKFSEERDRLQLLEHTLNWNHMAPTAPDTLSELTRGAAPVWCTGILIE